jgi:hypothetical protein
LRLDVIDVIHRNLARRKKAEKKEERAMGNELPVGLSSCHILGLDHSSISITRKSMIIFLFFDNPGSPFLVAPSLLNQQVDQMMLE